MSNKGSFSLEGHVALVTGSSKGLGRSMALSLGRAGAKVAMNYCHDQGKADGAIAELKDSGCQGMLVKGDVTKEEDVNRIHEEIAAELGEVDLLVINATCDQPHMPIEEYSWEFYQSMLDFFIKSPYLLTRACLPAMKRKNFGRIINIGSEVLHLGVPNFSAYVAAKGGQNGWSRSMARELAPFGITVNMVSPGWIPVERHEKEPQEWKDAYLPTIPVGRWGVPSDLSSTVVYLASEDSSFVTGQNIHVNGGLALF